MKGNGGALLFLPANALCKVVNRRRFTTHMTHRKTELDRATDQFFSFHWNESNIGSSPPAWRTWDRRGSPDEAQMGGCYAIYEDSKLLYIGLAVTEGKNAARGRTYGLLNRLRRHVLKGSLDERGQYPPQTRLGKEHWANLDCIRLIGFPAGQRYLAAALEIYLIDRMGPKINAQSRWRSEANGA